MLTKEEYSAMREAFIAVSNRLNTRADTRAFLNSVKARFGVDTVLEYRKNFTVMIEGPDHNVLFAYSGFSRQFYPIGTYSREALPAAA